MRRHFVMMILAALLLSSACNVSDDAARAIVKRVATTAFETAVAAEPSSPAGRQPVAQTEPRLCTLQIKEKDSKQHPITRSEPDANPSIHPASARAAKKEILEAGTVIAELPESAFELEVLPLPAQRPLQTVALARNPEFRYVRIPLSPSASGLRSTIRLQHLTRPSPPCPVTTANAIAATG